MTVRALLSQIRPNSDLFSHLDLIAATGDYDIAMLDGLLKRLTWRHDKSVRYYLASLYLHLNHPSAATEILAACGRPNRQMKKFFAVLDYSRDQGLPMPRLKREEASCIEYLSEVVAVDDLALAKYIESFTGFTVAGNSPTDRNILIDTSDCIILFNHHLKNPRLHCKPCLHVVTPSWEFDCPAAARRLVITGNSIFHRRSNVWRQFMHGNHYQAVFTMPRPLWSALYRKLGAPPSAGLLALAYLLEYVELSNIRGTVAGFCATIPSVNHSYDDVPASLRHNWAAECLLRNEYLVALNKQCRQLRSVPGRQNRSALPSVG